MNVVQHPVRSQHANSRMAGYKVHRNPWGLYTLPNLELRYAPRKLVFTDLEINDRICLLSQYRARYTVKLCYSQRLYIARYLELQPQVLYQRT